MASEAKTQPTDETIESFLARVEDPAKRADSARLVEMMSAATGTGPVIWGTGIVGFGRYRYQYASGKTGDWPVIAFAPRQQDLTLYLMEGFDRRTDLLTRLGKHKTGKVCLYLKKLADVDLGVLEELVRESVAGMASQRLPD